MCIRDRGWSRRSGGVSFRLSVWCITDKPTYPMEWFCVYCCVVNSSLLFISSQCFEWVEGLLLRVQCYVSRHFIGWPMVLGVPNSFLSIITQKAVLLWTFFQCCLLMVCTFVRIEALNDWPQGTQWILFPQDPQCSLSWSRGEHWGGEETKLTVSRGASH